ncbi:transcription factor kapC [Lecanosticta acicola]|uniref:Putative transcription factor kapC n=1 Tax=Lecanosticta acicola TaxID=111012 RepID=A0AAI8YSL3_9PEZI|nr:transcription factor kapC [Lecanosticta acicola]
MQRSAQQEPIEMSLREHLLAASSSGSAPSPYPPSAATHQGHEHQYPPPDGSHEHHLDPSVTGQHIPYGMSGDSAGDDSMSQDRKGKRELSTSKRAAQNRAAQRAFRQRKEGYIKKLEEQVKEFQTMEHNYKALQNENYQLREYILNLQGRLLENQSDFPPAPSHINLSSGGPPHAAVAAESSYGAEQQLRREMEHRTDQPQLPPAPVVAREDPARHDGLNQLQVAAAQEGRPQQHQSPYGLGGEYPASHPQPQPQQPPSRPEEPTTASETADSKPTAA